MASSSVNVTMGLFIISQIFRAPSWLLIVKSRTLTKLYRLFRFAFDFVAMSSFSEFSLAISATIFRLRSRERKAQSFVFLLLQTEGGMTR